MNKKDLNDLYFAVNELENIMKKLYSLDPNKYSDTNHHYYESVKTTISRARKLYDNLKNNL